MNRTSTRREFFRTTLAAVPLASAVAGTVRATGGLRGPSVCAFSKHLQFLDYGDLATTCREIGLDGVDLTVRSRGHVEPENVSRDLPAAVEAVRAEGLDVPMITTRLSSGADPDARPILDAASKLGIRYFRVGGQKYDIDRAPLPQLAGFTEDMRGLAKLAERYNMTAGYHNHSGSGNVGGPVWDLYRMIEEIGSPHLGSNFDCGHAMAEGMYGAWQVNVRLMAPYVKMMSVKDFVPGGSKPRWVPLGEGVVQTTEFLKVVRKAGFDGPISIHIEYDVPSDDAMIEEMRASAVTLRKCLKEAGYA